MRRLYNNRDVAEVIASEARHPWPDPKLTTAHYMACLLELCEIEKEDVHEGAVILTEPPMAVFAIIGNSHSVSEFYCNIDKVFVDTTACKSQTDTSRRVISSALVKHKADILNLVDFMIQSREFTEQDLEKSRKLLFVRKTVNE